MTDRKKEKDWDVVLEDEEEVVIEEIGEVTRQTIFFLEPEWYSIDTELVEEVMEVPPTTPVPHLPGFVHGLINLRGNIVVVVDIREFFDLDAIRLKERSRVAVVKVAEKTTGILVDYVSDVLDIPLKGIQPPLSIIKGAKAEFIKGQVKLPDGRFLVLLDLEKVMASDEMAIISKEGKEVK